MEENANTDMAIMILAGGSARRLGGVDKCLLQVGGMTILERILARLGGGGALPYPLAINANDNELGKAEDRFGAFGFPIFGDVAGVDGFGPLGGILSGLEYFSGVGGLFVIAGDVPFLPVDLLGRLRGEFDEGKDIVFSRGFGRRHPVVSLWGGLLGGDLRGALWGGVRKVEDFSGGYDVGEVDFGDDFDYFFNVNSKEDLEEAERLNNCA